MIFLFTAESESKVCLITVVELSNAREPERLYRNQPDPYFVEFGRYVPEKK